MHINNYVLVQTDKGQESGWVVREPASMIHMQPEDEPVLTVLRKATASDFGRWQEGKELQ